MRSLRFLLVIGFAIIAVLALQLIPKKQQIAVTSTAPPRATPLIRATDPRKGNPGAPIVLYEFSDFSCPSCQAVQPVLRNVLAQFPGKILHVWKDFPLPIHPAAIPAHIAGACANEQGKFWEYHDRLFARQSLTTDNYTAIATELGLDLPRFTACQKDATIQTRVNESFNEGRALGVDQTPFVFVNEKSIRTVNAQTLLDAITATLKNL